MKKYLFSIVAFLVCFTLQAQSGPSARQDTMLSQGGAWARLEVENGDSTFVMSLRPVKISARRTFKDQDEQRMYWRYTRAARKVYPYAIQAVGLYDQIQDETQGMNKRQRKRHIKHEHKELKEDMTATLKNLTKTEGFVLIKMIERELQKPFYDVIRETRGSSTAVYWNTFGKIYGYDLKSGYVVGTDALLDEVLYDYDFGDSSWMYR
ncbi:MAG: DUF4294 domain-containing protein [Saprospiraceae bacterium]|nr:DUF4294 domain-containing protein [Saprospiraceae bacterium]